MPQIKRSALVPHSAMQMYELVNDVDAYCEFLPWCAASETLETGADYKIARVLIQKGPLKQSFTTRNQLLSGESISMTLVEGPFSNLDGVWYFQNIGVAGCRINFEIQFAFSGFLIEKALSPVFNEICSRMVDAFSERARQRCT